MKKHLEQVKIEVISFDAEDVIATSGYSCGSYWQGDNSISSDSCNGEIIGDNSGVINNG